jgi:putative PIN family toxin of toxin-antitoxin system
MVLDTNVLIAALIARGVCADLLEHCVFHHQLVSSNHILGELERDLLAKFKFSDKDVAEALEMLRSQMQIVIPIALPQPTCRDADDDIVLATAITGNARCIITGDKDLLILQRYLHVEILSPSQFADFEAREGGTQPS